MRVSLLALMGLLSVVGCVSTHTTYRDLYKPYALLDSEPGWSQLSAPPKDADKIIRGVSNQKLNDSLSNHPYKITWFSNKAGQLLIYIQMHESVNCDEQVFTFTQTSGSWEVKPGNMILCLDSNE